MERKQKRYYKLGEIVFVKTEKALGMIQGISVKPEDGIFEAIVNILEGEKVNSLLKVNLWDIDKNKRNKAQEQRKEAPVKSEKKPTILFAKVRGDAIIPSKENENAGYDIYACFDEAYIRLEPHQTKLIPTGIASSVTDEWSLIGKERGSTGSKGMSIRAAVIDSGYRGEIFIAITNVNEKPLFIAKESVVFCGYEEEFVIHPANKAIAQLLLIPVPKANVKEIPYEQLKAIPSKRGTGKIGSSGK